MKNAVRFGAFVLGGVLLMSPVYAAGAGHPITAGTPTVSAARPIVGLTNPAPTTASSRPSTVPPNGPNTAQTVHHDSVLTPDPATAAQTQPH